MELRTQIRPPAPPTMWQAPGLAFAAWEAVIGEFGRPDFPAIGLEGKRDESPAVPPAEAQTPAVAEPEPIFAAPAPKVHVPTTPTTTPAEPATQPLPITLHAIGASSPAQITVTPLVQVPATPRTPAVSALPLRPVLVLGAAAKAVQTAPAAQASEPAPVAKAAPKVVEVPVPAARALRSSGGNRRADVRVTAVAPVRPTKAGASAVRPPAVTVTPVAAPPAEPKPIAAPPPEPTVAAKPATISQPSAAPEPAVSAAAPTGSILFPAEPSAVAPPAPEAIAPEVHLAMVQESFWSKLPGGVRVAIAATIALVIVGFAYYALNSNTATAKPAAAVPKLNYSVGSQINSGGWIDDWAPNDPQRRITLLRGSQPFSDYRVEFRAQIQNKAVGWMYRGINPRNFYVAKLEKLKNGLQPVVAFVRYAVIDGKPEGRVEVPLPITVRVDTTYKIRFDAVGPNFTVWVQDQQVAQWKDTRLGSGGLGLYSEQDEAAAVHGNVDVFELVANK
ncbi:MAG: hypothetical protein RL328_2476 [Acidobacteriota bacterium]